jgi:hypothetical protein
MPHIVETSALSLFCTLDEWNVVFDLFFKGDVCCLGVLHPHVLWDTVYKGRNNTAIAQAAMRALEVIGLPVREIKVQSGKCKNHTKVDLPIMNGLEVIKVVDGCGAMMEAVPSPSDLGVVEAYKV